MRASAKIFAVSTVAFAVSAWRYSAISTDEYLRNAAEIMSNPNGDVIWLENWQLDRKVYFGFLCVSGLSFVISYISLWKGQQESVSKTGPALPDDRHRASGTG